MQATSTEPSFNSNHTAEPNTQLPVHMVKCVEEVVQQLLCNSLWYRVQCTTVDGAAEILKVYPDTIRQWIYINKLQASKIGREWSIRLVDIDKMLTANVNVVRMDDKRFKRNKKAS